MTNDSNAALDTGHSLTFAHITDAHLTSPRGARWQELLNKRLLSYLSWRRHRRQVHDSGVLAALMADLKGSGVDHVAITGDLTHLGLSQECREALEWLTALADPKRISLIPGNHDRLVDAAWADTVGLWRSFMVSEQPEARPDHDFPALRIRGPVAFIGLSSAVPTAPFLATGKLGQRQREELGRLLTRTGLQRLFRVVLIHHPPVPQAYKWRKRLVDCEAVSAVIRKAGAELVLHGHTHRLTRNVLTSADGAAIPVVGLASASSRESARERAARYSIWSVHRGADGVFSLSHRSRRYDARSGEIRECDDWNPLAGS
ncbi:MAG: metallophosphoesterase [Gammaproteobacteria bacterium]|jgi:3',5'-cyclic AMP phosphodiesterase CpdA